MSTSRLTLAALERHSIAQQSPPAPPPPAPPSRPYVMDAPIARPAKPPQRAAPRVPQPQPQLQPPKPAASNGPVISLTSRNLKCTVVLNAAELIELNVPEGAPRQTLRIEAGGRVCTASVASKSVRKAISTIREHGVEAVALIIQGKLLIGDVIEEAGLVAQLKAPKPAAPAEAS